MLHTFSRVPLLSVCLLVNAARLEEERDLFDIASANGADDLRIFIDFEHSGLSNHQNSKFVSIGEERPKRRGGKGATSKKQSAAFGEQVNVSADEMQRGLLEFLKQHRVIAGLPEFHNPPKRYKTLLASARAEAKGWQSWKVPPSSCLKQLGGLLQELNSECWKIMKRKMRKANIKIRGVDSVRDAYEFHHLTNEPMPTCPESAEDIFLHGKDVVQAQQVGDDFAKDAPTATKPLLQAGLFLKAWIINLATAKKAGILWAGFWTDATWHHLARLARQPLFHAFHKLAKLMNIHVANLVRTCQNLVQTSFSSISMLDLLYVKWVTFSNLNCTDEIRPQIPRATRVARPKKVFSTLPTLSRPKPCTRPQNLVD